MIASPPATVCLSIVKCSAFKIAVGHLPDFDLPRAVAQKVELEGNVSDSPADIAPRYQWSPLRRAITSCSPTAPSTRGFRPRPLARLQEVSNRADRGYGPGIGGADNGALQTDEQRQFRRSGALYFCRLDIDSELVELPVQKSTWREVGRTFQKPCEGQGRFLRRGDLGAPPVVLVAENAFAGYLVRVGAVKPEVLKAPWKLTMR